MNSSDYDLGSWKLSHREIPVFSYRTLFTKSIQWSLPSKIQFPIETTPRHIAGRNVLKGIVANHINDGTDNGCPVFSDPG